MSRSLKSCKDPKKCAQYLSKALEECIPEVAIEAGKIMKWLRQEGRHRRSPGSFSGCRAHDADDQSSAAEGVHHFAMVHNSIGVHAADIDVLNRVLRIAGLSED